jgi:hypothetical protein
MMTYSEVWLRGAKLSRPSMTTASVKRLNRHSEPPTSESLSCPLFSFSIASSHPQPREPFLKKREREKKKLKKEEGGKQGRNLLPSLPKGKDPPHNQYPRILMIIRNKAGKGRRGKSDDILIFYRPGPKTSNLVSLVTSRQLNCLQLACLKATHK